MAERLRARLCLKVLKASLKDCQYAMAAATTPLGMVWCRCAGFIAGLVKASGYLGFRHQSLCNRQVTTAFLVLHWARAMKVRRCTGHSQSQHSPSGLFAQMYADDAKGGRPSIASEKLLRAMLL